MVAPDIEEQVDRKKKTVCMLGEESGLECSSEE